MQYSSEDDVYDATGYDSTTLQTIANKTAAKLTDLINSYIANADKRINRLLKIPIVIQTEKHVGDGQTLQVELGPWDENLGIFDYDPENCLEAVYAVYDGAGRVRLPYPKDCELGTEKNATDWGNSNATLSNEQRVVKCGEYSLKGIFSAAGYVQYPSTANLDKNIYPWGYIGLWVYCSDASVTFTIRLYDKDGNYDYKTFTVDKANTWKFIRLNVDEFTGSIDWSDTNLFEIRIYVDKACTAYFDNFNFNDGWWWTYPKGTLNYGKISNGEGWFSEGAVVKVTYSYNPYRDNVPEDIKYISSRMAGLQLVEFLIGIRQQHTAFEQEVETMEPKGDKWTLEATRSRLQKEIDEALAGIGYGGTTGMG